MPIFEFKCLKCGYVFEELIMNSQEKIKISCPECQSDSFERVVSAANYAMGGGPGGHQPKITTKSCGPSNKCMTLDLPGPSE